MLPLNSYKQRWHRHLTLQVGNTASSDNCNGMFLCTFCCVSRIWSLWVLLDPPNFLARSAALQFARSSVVYPVSESFYSIKVYIAHINVVISYFTYPSLAARDQEGLPVSDFESWLWCKERHRPVVRGVNYSNAESETWKRSDLSSVLYRNVKPIVGFIQVLSRLFFCNSKQSKKIFNLVIIIVSMSLLINSVRHTGRYIRWIIIQ